MTRKRSAKSPRTHVGLEQRFVASVRALELKPGQSVVVGFSGGKDSLALAQLFARTKAVTGIDARLLHVDHRLRSSSAAEATRARQLGNQVGLPVGVAELAPGLADRHPGLGIEEAARRERYLELSRYARTRKTYVIAVAHQRQDQAESVLMHLLRGSGLSGMAAMSALTEVQIPWWEGSSRRKPFRIWRPLLDEDPAELAEYLRSHDLTPIEDPSNSEADFLRNRVRADVLPVLEAIQPNAVEAIARFANIATAENNFLDSIADAAYRAMFIDGVRINRAEAQAAHPIFLRRVIRRAIESTGVDGVSYDRVEQVASLVSAQPTDRVIQLGGKGIAVADESWIYIGDEQSVYDQIQTIHEVWLLPVTWNDDQSLEIRLDCPVSVEGVTIHASANPGNLGKRRPWRPVLPAEAFEGGLELRMTRNGDTWARQSGTIREYLRKRGIPPIARARIMVFASPKGIWYVPGVGHSPSYNRFEREDQIYLDIQEVK